MIEGTHVSCVGTHMTVPVDDVDIDSIERRVKAQGFEYNREGDVLRLRAAVVNGLVYRNIEASPSAKFGDSRELTMQFTTDGIIATAPTVFSPVILQGDVEAILSQIRVDANGGATAYRLEFADSAPSFETIPSSLQKLGVVVEDKTEDSFVCRLDDYTFQVYSDGLAYPAHAPEDEREDIERFVTVLNEALKSE